MRLAVFIASVITQRKRLEYFGYLLDSIRAQKVKPDCIIISLHLAEAKWLAKINFGGLANLKIITQVAPIPQFVGFRACLESMEGGDKETYIVFSDDDDIWHEGRIGDIFESLSDTLQDIKSSKRPLVALTTLLLSPQVSMQNYETIKNFPTPKTSKDIDRAIYSGCLVPKKAFDHYNDYKFFEIHQCVPRADFFCQFIKEHRFFVEQNKFCDLLFTRWIRSIGGDSVHVAIFQKYGHGWMYFYRTNLGPSYVTASNYSVDMSTEEIAMRHVLLLEIYSGSNAYEKKELITWSLETGIPIVDVLVVVKALQKERASLRVQYT